MSVACGSAWVALYIPGTAVVATQITIACVTQYAGAAYVRHEKE
jgi:hypothetical protein